MNTHYCRVGTIRPNANKTLTSKASENSAVKSETNNVRYFGKLSK